MWQRFTERARKVVFYAQEEAQRFGQGCVGPEHLLLGLVREPNSLGCRALESLDIDLTQLKEEVERKVIRGGAQPVKEMTLTPRAKRVIDLAYREAKALGNNFIGSEHILLALIAEENGVAAVVLARYGADLTRAREVVAGLQSAEGTASEKGKAQSRFAGLKAQVEHAVASISSVDKTDEQKRLRTRPLLVLVAGRSSDVLAIALLYEPTATVADGLEALGIAPTRLAARVVDLLAEQGLHPTADTAEAESAGRLLDRRQDSAQVFGRIAADSSSLTHQALIALGATDEAIRVAFPVI